MGDRVTKVDNLLWIGWDIWLQKLKPRVVMENWASMMIWHKNFIVSIQLEFYWHAILAPILEWGREHTTHLGFCFLKWFFQVKLIINLTFGGLLIIGDPRQQPKSQTCSSAFDNNSWQYLCDLKWYFKYIYIKNNNNNNKK